MFGRFFIAIIIAFVFWKVLNTAKNFGAKSAEQESVPWTQATKALAVIPVPAPLAFDPERVPPNGDLVHLAPNAFDAYLALETVNASTVTSTISNTTSGIVGGTTVAAVAESGQVAQMSPAPATVPLPTNMFSSTPNVNLTTSNTTTSVPSGTVAVTPYSDADNASTVTPIDAVMSEWTQWSTCNARDESYRTRTCIHDSINGGKACGHTLETRFCI